MMIAPILNNDLYTILRDNVGMSANLLEQYTYPDVEHDRLAAFIAELRDLLEIQRQLLPPFNFQMLKGLLQIAAELDALPYLEDEPPTFLSTDLETFTSNASLYSKIPRTSGTLRW
ncbi:hypothetical protein PhaeoP83_03835 (plasmid) [Phaeobacter inhibens]|uniref:Uncharacterized protein n=2 Tax=Phaeobacter inhibens TaxID=221822 RepID=A0A2I7K229_9RHOB|nr:MULTISPECIES: hypothetical protein [Phaeobacter]AUQ52053.1 hypothetical protein PhaeoP83_03835 [Phaeobacter inhibens]AUQ96657.1 hypothetical protein PhaeoP66_03931 [Phaeobacter inhibens]AUR01169.1 hypothetical protein PhaeoP88_03857 [Phaeobacter inhibens]AUR05765.1 hypothetical protein PhaeoP72_03847 [Phaeobacter inhibens]AUR21858.1 hypothetical protein PhaeoP80_03835 [Phaeobacter inhibens]